MKKFLIFKIIAKKIYVSVENISSKTLEVVKVVTLNVKLVQA